MNWTLFWIIVFFLLVLTVLYVLSTRCRKSKAMRKFRPYYYAHRGLHDAVRPENSLAAFQAARDAGYGIELDVHLIKDGTLVVIHDHDLLRTTGQQGCVEDLTREDLWHYQLENSPEHIPTFAEVLELMGGKTPLIVELKANKKNHAALTQAVCDQLENYPGLYCIESFDPRCLRWLRKNRPEILRGQLSRNFFRDKKSKLPWILKLLMTCQLLNFWTRPDFVAYLFAERKRLGNRLVKKVWGAARVAWTIRTPEDCKTARREGWIPIFENFEP